MPRCFAGTRPQVPGGQRDAERLLWKPSFLPRKRPPSWGEQFFQNNFGFRKIFPEPVISSFAFSRCLTWWAEQENWKSSFGGRLKLRWLSDFTFWYFYSCILGGIYNDHPISYFDTFTPAYWLELKMIIQFHISIHPAYWLETIIWSHISFCRWAGMTETIGQMIDEGEL